ncbi:hypothetical protein BGZ83_004973 [Gryganskiella cystojenkinii]|nr:hypothetical protein BGZ83_004973 [Gryganskiella cystojenkinii]
MVLWMAKGLVFLLYKFSHSDSPVTRSDISATSGTSPSTVYCDDAGWIQLVSEVVFCVGTGLWIDGIFFMRKNRQSQPPLDSVGLSSPPTTIPSAFISTTSDGTDTPSPETADNAEFWLIQNKVGRVECNPKTGTVFYYPPVLEELFRTAIDAKEIFPAKPVNDPSPSPATETDTSKNSIRRNVRISARRQSAFEGPRPIARLMEPDAATTAEVVASCFADRPSSKSVPLNAMS